jgi:tetratricopeptide (TPR) repeat protein
MKQKIIFLVLLVFLLSSFSIADDFSDAMLKAKKNLNSAINKNDEKALLKVRGEFERILQLKKDTWLVYYYISFTDYSIATTYMKDQVKDKIKKYNESALEMINKSIEINSDFCDSYVMIMNLQFNRWVYEQDKMNDIIASSDIAAEKAKKLDPDNPRYYLTLGVSSYYTPEMFGGGIDKALESLNKSYDLFQTRKEKEEYYPDWGKDITYGYLAMSYIKRDKEGDLVKAKEYLDKGIEAYPDSGFLKGYVQKLYDDKIKDKK